MVHSDTTTQYCYDSKRKMKAWHGATVALQTKQLVTGEWSFPVTERAAPGDLALELAEQGFRGASAWLPVGECIHH